MLLSQITTDPQELTDGTSFRWRHDQSGAGDRVLISAAGLSLGSRKQRGCVEVRARLSKLSSGFTTAAPHFVLMTMLISSYYEMRKSELLTEAFTNTVETEFNLNDL
jgi:hypothetical protein